MKYKLLPNLDDVLSAYDVATENYPEDLEPDSVEGRRELISSALNYLKDIGVVPSQQSLKLIQNELIRNDKENYDSLFGLAENEEETTNLVERLWNECSIDFIYYASLEWSTSQGKLAKCIDKEILPMIRNLTIEGMLCLEDFATIKKNGKFSFSKFKKYCNF